MWSLILIVATLTNAVVQDSARIVGSSLIVEPVGLHIDLPGEWFGAKDTIAWPPSCGHELRGSVDRRLATSRVMLDSVKNARGEWDREYSAVTDSILPFDALVAQLGPEPFGAGQCFGDLQMRVYVLPATIRVTAQSMARGLTVARSFFQSAEVESRDSTRWHINRLHWDAWFYDYGAEANVEIFTTSVRGRTIALVFMRPTVWNDRAERDQRFILDHVRFQ
jgi:hypothetical protein